mmetsp:Transcript_2413/g.4225  ORF Transcript_2413/g.4225 Transcript_2413/m.4225 type:complete len:399 (-) Transcript_2413:71-1267(-)
MGKPVAEEVDDAVKDGLNRALSLFESTYGCKASVAVAAPGRVNLIGEHTDYNEGFVFPLALEKNTVLVANPRDDQTVSIVSEFAAGKVVTFEASPDLQPGEPEWANYVKGMVAIFMREGIPVKGFNAAIASDVPAGGGVSSSAALEMAAGTVLEALNEHELKKSVKAQWGQKVEHEFANVPCGIMDQLISASAHAGHALLIDCRSLETTLAPLDDPSVCIVVTNSNVKHSLSGSEYPQRREQCATAAKALGVGFLRDATMEQLEALPSDALDSVTIARARHVISEDERTLQFLEALKARKYDLAGQLMNQSHVSMRDDYEVSVPEIDQLVEIAQSVKGVYGSRLTGGGFGGCTVTLVDEKAVPDLLKAIDEKYLPDSKKKASYFVTKAGKGARVLKLE